MIQKNYRPITNLVTISKFLERLVSEYQSAYRRGHSTETALLKIIDDIHSAMESRSGVVLLALDISAAFDTINHEILLKRLECDFGITSVALDWIRSYISDRECYVAVSSNVSDSWKCVSSISQRSVLGPLFFPLYVAPIAQIFGECGIKFHQYADDTQLYTGVNSADISNFEALRNCRMATNWFLANDLQLNADKTEAILFGTRQQLAKHQDKVLRLGECDVSTEARSRFLASSSIQHYRWLHKSIDRQVLQLPYSCTAPHSEMPNSRSHEDNRFRSSHFSTRLLQLIAVQHFEVQYQQVAAYPEESSESRHTIFMEERCTATAQSTALASDRRQDQIQNCRHHTQSTFKFRASLSKRPSEGTRHGRDPPASFRRPISPGATICKVVWHQGRRIQLCCPFGLEQSGQTMQNLWLSIQRQKTAQNWTVCCARRKHVTRWPPFSLMHQSRSLQSFAR